ncbi:MAG: FKBP-type peptidyl-prolyl cis-trans isomerase [Micrococcales bacterium]|nr:FKBP-type peptidyl-prolyl cis-trans isomerase [Micrococcales bacterium]
MRQTLRWLTLACLFGALAACSATPAPPGSSQAPSVSPSLEPAGPELPLPTREPPELRPEIDKEIVDLITWETTPEGLPMLAFDPPLGVSGPVAKLISDGSGQLIQEGDMVTFDYTMFAGDTGEVTFTTYDNGQPQTIQVLRSGMSQSFADTLIGSHVGAHIIFAQRDSSGTAPTDLVLTQFMAVVVTAAKTVPDRAQGTPVTPIAGLPTVTLAENGEPDVTLPAGPPPGRLVSQLLIQGEGKPVQAGQTILVQYKAWIWDGAELFNTSWEGAPAAPWQMSNLATLSGLVQGLLGQPVGSQVLLIIPPELGFGDVEANGVPAGSTLVYVVDVLDAS